MKGNDTRLPDIEALSYCCLECGDRCPIYRATASDDRTVKRAVAELWTKEMGQPFTADDVFCHGCKIEGKPQNKALLKCAVRQCAIGRQMGSCSRCGDLKACDHSLWKNWPEVKKQALQLQQAITEILNHNSKGTS